MRNERSLNHQQFPKSRMHPSITRFPLLECPARRMKCCCAPILRSSNTQLRASFHGLSNLFNLVRCWTHEFFKRVSTSASSCPWPAVLNLAASSGVACIGLGLSWAAE